MDRRSFFLALPAVAVATVPPANGKEQDVFPNETRSASWEVVFPENANKDGFLVHHTLTKPSAGLHILGTARDGVTGGYSLGAAMNGPGTANAVTGNRYQDGNGHGTTGARVGTGDGFGGHFGFSSEGTGGALAAVKQNSGYTGLSGAGPALAVDNLSDNGAAIVSATSANNHHPVSNEMVRLNSRHGIISDQRAAQNDAREAPFIGNRVALHPGDLWSGEHPVTAYQAIINENTTGSPRVTAGEFITDATENATNIALMGVARGGNQQNYGGWFIASGGAVNVALRADGDFWLIDGSLYAPNLPVYDNNSQALEDRLEPGRVYRTQDGTLRIVV